ncbi:hypothetical protein AB2C32_33915, partial [Pseudomonas aeruginosa]
AVRANLHRIDEVRDWWGVVAGPVTPVIADAAVTAAALDTLPPEPYGPETWKAWTTTIRERTGAKGKALFMPLRLALTGLEHGPD